MLVDSGKVALAERAVGLVANEGFEFALYTNAVTWSHSTVLADLVEAAWSGYARTTVPNASWGTPTLDPSFNAVAQASVLASYLNSSGATQTAQGFFVVGATSGTLYGGGPFNTPLTINNGDTVSTYPLYLENTL